MAAPAWESAELAERIRWFIRLRWVAVGAIVLVTRMATAIFAIPLDPFPLYLTALAVAIYNGLFRLDHRRREEGLTTEAAVVSANLQIAFDLVALTVLLHYSGGAENPFASYYVFHLIIASILLSRGASYLQAAFALSLFGGLIALEYAGAIPHVDVWGLAGEGAYRRGSYLLAVWTALGSTLLLAVYFATSITSRLRAREAQVLRLKEALEAEAFRLQEAYRACVETERAKSRYLLKVGHEVRAPLSAVQSLFRVIQEGLAGELPAKARELIVRAAQRVEDLLGMVSDLLELARAREAPAQELHSVDLRVILEQVLDRFRPEAEERRVALNSGLAPEPLTLRGDAEALATLFTNLLSNAFKYTPAGGRVEVTAAAEGKKVVVRVADIGIGIAPEDLTKIWEEFYRSPRAREAAREGT
ncbi:MAG: HAMP domain-containing histidine kinase, partial [Nitrospirae bacterium]|nr:HAMP domain-containing histidine kinase [Nitrospirota bacterium]